MIASSSSIKDTQDRYAEASIKTSDSLKTIAHSEALRDVSPLSLPEIDAVVDLVAQVVPAGNVPGVILNGLAHLAGRKPPLKAIRRDIDLLFRGVEQVLDRAVYSAFFAGPAAVIWGYQNLLKLAGKDPDDAFPDGTWQFYVDYALREDTARHASETHGFDTVLSRHQIQLSMVDRVTAWLMAVIDCLHQYDRLLENEWRERVYIRLLCKTARDEPEVAQYAQLYREWTKQRPYSRGQDAGANQSYTSYRRVKFDQFLARATRHLREDVRRAWIEQIRFAEKHDLPAYQRQMSILAYLDPGLHGETHVPVPIERAHVALVHRGRYYLIPVCAPGTAHPIDVAAVREQVATLMAHPPGVPVTRLVSLAELKRTSLARLRARGSAAFLDELSRLRLAPILLNSDRRPHHLTLTLIRRAERGIGDHALTLFDTGRTMVFDQSHIFFDGAWGAAFSEIVTKEALSWAVYLDSLPDAQPGKRCPYVLSCSLEEPDRRLIARSARVMPEAGAETDAVDLKAVVNLRTLFKQRNDLLQLTVNDLLVLYRAIHAVTYEPDPDLYAELKRAAQKDATHRAAMAALMAIERSQQVNPAILIPVDASERSPRDRLYPMTFEVPLVELDLLNMHRQVISALNAYERARGDRTVLYQEFDRLQHVYLAALAGFGIVLSKAKEVTLGGKSGSVGAIKLLAHIPPPLQRMLDLIPDRINILNDVIKGREVFSNLGAVAPSSTLTRFITAKDDNDQKIFAWAVITDAHKVMRITLRDFRSHIHLFQACGRMDLALSITQDYLDAYVRGFNDFVGDLMRIARASRETHASKPERRDD